MLPKLPATPSTALQARLQSVYPALLLFGILSLFSLAFIRTAWIAEDTFITFRTIDNAINGLGLRWNAGERVQTFTHPLWLGLLLPAIAVFGDPYFVTLALCFALLFATLLIISHTLGQWSFPAALAILPLLWSRAFIDYSSSGLENPLTHLLLALTVLTWLKAKNPPRKTLALSLLAALLFLTRPDAVLLVGPALFSHLWSVRAQFRAHIGVSLLGLSPALIWIAFSLFYYGSPVPNTALAKLGTGLDLGDKALQGWRYLEWTILTDFVSAALIVAGSVLGLTRAQRELRPFSIALLLWCLYLFMIGGDYMAGRFFSAPVLMAAIMLALAMHRTASMPTAGAIAVLLLTQMTALNLTLFSPADFHQTSIAESGIADERGYYNLTLGLVPALERKTWFVHGWLIKGRSAREAGGVHIACAVGMLAYASGPGVYWIDPLALTEPFLARLPSRTTVRIGHFERALPAGYLASRLTQKNLIKDPKLRALYADVELATRAPLLAAGRFAAIWRLNSGHHAGAAQNFDRNPIGPPGDPIKDRQIYLCMGNPV